MARLTVIGLAAILFLSSCSLWRRGGTSPEEREALKRSLSNRSPAYAATDPEGPQLWKRVRGFYKRREYNFAWMSGGEATKAVDELILALERAPSEGFDPAEYDLQKIKARREESNHRFPFFTERPDPQATADYDTQLTFQFLKYGSHLLRGRMNDVPQPARKVDLIELLEHSVAEATVEQNLEGLSPKHSEFAALREELQRYRNAADRGGWKPLQATRALKKGHRGSEVVLLRQRLALTGDFRSKADDQALFDAELEEAVKRFQERHQITPDGRLSRTTLAALNVPVELRIRQIQINMDRWRRLPQELGRRHVRVNVPELHLYVIDQGRAALDMKVIVGKTDNRTPVFSDQIEQVVFSPYWHIPPSIAEKETIPSVLKDPDFLTKNNIEMVDHRGRILDPWSIDLSYGANVHFRQRPGPRNSLGLVKFMFPNDFDVYLHDTPADSLFGRMQRLFSHGCVRVEKPVELAGYLLREERDWETQRILAAMHAGTPKTVALKTPVPIHILYFTVWIENGALHFGEDVYGYDRAQLKELS